MDRRTFVLLGGAASGAAFLRPRPGIAPGARGPAPGGLEFTLDERRRWSLWYRRGATPVPLLTDAEVVLQIGGRPVALADLQGTAVGSRELATGAATAVRGRAAGTVVDVIFLAGGDPPAATITVTVYPDLSAPPVERVRFFQAGSDDVLAGPGALVALVNGFESWNANRVVQVGPDADAASAGALALTRGTRGLALAFDAGGPGTGTFRISAAGLEALSESLPPRPVAGGGDAATLRLAYTPRDDGLSALAGLLVPPSQEDRDRLARAVAPAGWCSWYDLYGKVTEGDVLANLAFCAAHFDPHALRYIQLDDGYQRATGDWEMNAKFPSGHRALTDRIHGAGFLAGLWIAPFAVTDRSGVPAAHPDWLLQDASGPIVWDTRDDWGGRVYSIDGAHPEVGQFLRDLARRIVRDWGYDYLKIDFLLWAAAGLSHYGGATHAEAYRAGLQAIRDGLGTEAFLLGCGAPLQHALGFVNGMRIGTDVDPSWPGIEAPARAAALRSFYQRAAWINDPDCLVVRPPLSRDEARSWASIVALSGGLTMFSDDLTKLPAERLPLLQKTIPVSLQAGTPLETQVVERAPAPALVLGGAVYPIAGPWRFRTGDDPRYAARDFDETAWETITVPSAWERAGHPGYDGIAWYRARFSVPVPSPEIARGDVYLELGKVDDADETYLNGVRVGATGTFPPNYQGDWNGYRRYPVPGDAVNWGGENVLAVRVYDGGGDGGLWSFRHDAPPRLWIAEGAPGWWTAGIVNWDDAAAEVIVPLGTLGLAGGRYAAYDVWGDAPLPDVTDAITATLEPHQTLVVALRQAALAPQVIGTTRHVVQGAVDITDETWDPAARVLGARSANLDGRAYAVTVAVPRGFTFSGLTSEVTGTVRTLPTGHLLLEWPEGTKGDVLWRLGFAGGARRRRSVAPGA